MTAVPDPVDSGVPTSMVRDSIQRLGLLTAARNTRAFFRREMQNWITSGCPSPAPNVVKMAIVRHHVVAFATPTFIETGTYMGSMIEHIAATGVDCFSIEIDRAIHDRAKLILGTGKKIKLILGDSAIELPKLLDTLDRPATFWLDGHYSGTFTGKADEDTPVSAELNHIMQHPIKKHVILIDDAREFNGNNGYPRLSEILSFFDDHPTYQASVSADIIRITPR